MLIQKFVKQLQDNDENWYDFYHSFALFDHTSTSDIDEMLMDREYGKIRGFEIINGKRVM